MVHPAHVVSILDHLIAASDDPHSPAHTPTALIAPNLNADNALRISMTITQPQLGARLINALRDEARHRSAAHQHHYPIAVDLNFPALFAAWYRTDSSPGVVGTLLDALGELSLSAGTAEIYMHGRLNDHQLHDALPIALLGVFSPSATTPPLARSTRVTHFHNTTCLDHEGTPPSPSFACHSTQLADLLDVPCLAAISHPA